MEHREKQHARCCQAKKFCGEKRRFGCLFLFLGTLLCVVYAFLTWKIFDLKDEPSSLGYYGSFLNSCCSMDFSSIKAFTSTLHRFSWRRSRSIWDDDDQQNVSRKKTSWCFFYCAAVYHAQNNDVCYYVFVGATVKDLFWVNITTTVSPLFKKIFFGDVKMGMLMVMMMIMMRMVRARV